MPFARSLLGSSARRAAPAALLALCIAAVVACRTPSAPDVAPLQAEILARTRELEELFRSGNLLGVADVYADDAVLLDHRGERTTGRAEIDAYWSSIEEPVEWTLEVREIRGSGAVAYQLGTSRLTTRRAGAPETSVTDFLVVWRRDAAGEWRIDLDAYWPAETR